MDEIRLEVNKKLSGFLRFLPLSGWLKMLKDAILDGKDVIFQDAPHMIVVSVDKKSPCANIDPIIALSYFELYAQSLGVGTLWCGFADAAIRMTKSVKSRLNIPKTHKIAYTMLFGYPSRKYARAIQPEKYSYSEIK